MDLSKYSPETLKNTLLFMCLPTLFIFIFSLKSRKLNSKITLFLAILSFVFVLLIININITIGLDETFSLNEKNNYIPFISLVEILLLLLSPAILFNRRHKLEKSRVAYMGNGPDF